MDERERGKIRKTFQQKPCQLKITTLPLGDYILSADIAIERKRGDDFVASIYDHRLFHQLTELKANFKYPFIILETPKKLFEREFINKSSVYGAMVYVMYKMKIPIIPSTDSENSVNLIFDFATQIQQSDEYQPFDITMITNSEEHVISRHDQSYFLQGLVDTGPVKANRFLDIFRTPQFLFHAIDSTSIQFTRGGNPKSISGMMEQVKGIGVKYIDRNQRLLTSSYKSNKKLKERIRK